MPQIGIHINKKGEGVIYADHGGTVNCVVKNCDGKITFKMDGHISTWDKSATCNCCGQLYSIKLSG